MRAFLRLLVAAAALAAPLAALAQQPGNTTALVVSTCGAPPSAYITGNPGPLTVDTTGKLCTSGGGGTPGGTNGQVQFNNAGAFGGFTVSGDGTLNTSTGALVVTKTNGVSFGALATVTAGTGVAAAAANAVDASGGLLTFASIGTSGAKLGLLNTANTVGAQWTFPAGAAATPSFVVGAGQTGLYSTASTTLGFSVNGSVKGDYGVSSAGAWTFQGAITATGQIASQTVVQASTGFYLNAKAQIIPSAVSGSMSLQNWAGGDWGLLQFGGTTASFPALKRNLTALNVRLADDSGDAPLTAASISTSSTTLHTTTVALTNGAAAGAGTITNAPASGNPTKWIPINDNGTTRYIPAW